MCHPGSIVRFRFSLSVKKNALGSLKPFDCMLARSISGAFFRCPNMVQQGVVALPSEGHLVFVAL